MTFEMATNVTRESAAGHHMRAWLRSTLHGCSFAPMFIKAASFSIVNAKSAAADPDLLTGQIDTARLKSEPALLIFADVTRQSEIVHLLLGLARHASWRVSVLKTPVGWRVLRFRWRCASPPR